VQFVRTGAIAFDLPKYYKKLVKGQVSCSRMFYKKQRMTAGKRMTKLRESLNMTQRELANAIGVTDQTISNWERGIHIPKLTPRQMANLCKATGLGIEEIADLLEP
jgi:DNA-binding XRE family transcriptional regulator